jgi:hypothetical protein
MLTPHHAHGICASGLRILLILHRTLQDYAPCTRLLRNNTHQGRCTTI